MRHKYKVKLIRIWIDFIGYEVEVAFVGDTRHYRNVHLVKKNPDMNIYEPEFYALHTCIDHKSWVIYPTKPDKGTVIHELVHVVENIMRQYSFQDEELRAYLMGYLTNKVLQKW